MSQFFPEFAQHFNIMGIAATAFNKSDITMFAEIFNVVMGLL